jgi:predicted GNAT family N-acyltransferase
LVRVERITIDHPLYQQECSLRDAVLLRPIGYDMARFRAEYAGMEEAFLHFVALAPHSSGARVVGCALLRPHYPQPHQGKVMQVAVDPQRQGEGIGRQLIIAIESHAFGSLRLGEVFCHAQMAAVGFYETLGWDAEGDVFIEAGIDHRRMVIRNAVPADAPADTGQGPHVR